MEVRLGDLYEFIVRIVEDRLRQQSGAPQRPAELLAPPPSVSDNLSETAQWRVIQEQLETLVGLHRQLLDISLTHQQHTEALLSDILKALQQLLDSLRAVNEQQANEEQQEKGTDHRKRHDRRPRMTDRIPMPNPQALLPSNLDEGIAEVPPDKWLEEDTAATIVEEVAPDGATGTIVKPPSASLMETETLSERLSEFLRRLFGVEVDYLQSRPPSSPALQNARVMVGEGTHNGQPMTLTVYAKPEITAADVSVFYNAVVRPLRRSVTETVMGIMVGETFEPKALKVAHTLDLLLLNATDLFGNPSNDLTS